MAAPTPVSALVHSSTLVAAGVYLLIRFSPSFSYRLNIILLLVSGLTIFMAGLGANFEFDLGRIIALSTSRQLGLMVITICIGLSSLAFFHLLTRAFFLIRLYFPACSITMQQYSTHCLQFYMLFLSILYTFNILLSIYCALVVVPDYCVYKFFKVFVVCCA